MHFKEFKQIFQANAAKVLNSNRVFKLDIDPDTIWAAYLSGFSGTEVQENNCHACRRFLQSYGGLVAISNDLKVTGLWDFNCGSAEFQPAVNAVRDYLKDLSIKEVFCTSIGKLGTDRNVATTGNFWWDHFYLSLPNTFRLTNKDKIGFQLNECRTGKAVYQRALEEITLSAVDTVLDLIKENALYRGAESKGILELFRAAKVAYSNLTVQQDKDNFCWLQERGALSDIRSSAIGTLLVDLSELDADVEKCVKAFEFKVAPQNYQRPKTIVTASMVDNAKAKLAELGLEQSIYRRFAKSTDLNVNNLLFVDRSSGLGDIFTEIKENLPVNISKLKNITEVSVEDFLVMLQSSTSAEIFFEESQTTNLFSLIAPKFADSPSLFKWDNQFSWAYKGGMADSIAQRVKKAGGNISGLVRVSLAWDTSNDLDLHIYEASGFHLYYGSSRSLLTKAELDVDANAGRIVENPVENIIYPYDSKLTNGKYKIEVNNFNDRESTETFTVEIEIAGVIYTYVHNERIRTYQDISIGSFDVLDGAIVYNGPASSTGLASTKDIWNLGTNKFHKVLAAFESPNYWSDNAVGNKHLFFQLAGAQNTDGANPFFNEQLNQNLTRDHKRVFEVLGSKLKIEESVDQISGLGFSSTQPATFYCKLDAGKIVKVKIGAKLNDN